MKMKRLDEILGEAIEDFERGGPHIGKNLNFGIEKVKLVKDILEGCDPPIWIMNTEVFDHEEEDWLPGKIGVPRMEEN